MNVHHMSTVDTSLFMSSRALLQKELLRCFTSANLFTLHDSQLLNWEHDWFAMLTSVPLWTQLGHVASTISAGVYRWRLYLLPGLRQKDGRVNISRILIAHLFFQAFDLRSTLGPHEDYSNPLLFSSFVRCMLRTVSTCKFPNLPYTKIWTVSRATLPDSGHARMDFIRSKWAHFGWISRKTETLYCFSYPCAQVVCVLCSVQKAWDVTQKA